MLGTVDFDKRLRAVSDVDACKAARAGLTLLGGARRIRTGGGGLYPTPARPVTKPVEALSAWIESIYHDAEESGEAFGRKHELREAVGAAAAEVDAAVQDCGESPALAHLHSALFRDALGVMDPPAPLPPPPISWYESPTVPWVAAGTLSGVLIGLLLAMLGRRR